MLEALEDSPSPTLNHLSRLLSYAHDLRVEYDAKAGMFKG
jgi:hypothetical protein